MGKKCLSLTIALAAALFVLGGVTSSHATLTYSDWILFPGSTNPIPSGITATFTQSGADHVTLTMSVAPGVDPLIKVDQWGFNYGGGITALAVSWVSGVPAATEKYTTWDQKTKADGDGYYNLYFYFPDSGQTLSAGDKIVYDLYGAGLTENSFIFKSALDKDGTTLNPNGYYSAIHALGLPPHPGSWAGAKSYGSVGTGGNVPIPTAAWLLALGLIGLAVIRRRIK